MRYLILLTLTLCSAAGAAEMWRWVDSNGVVHYSDRFQPGAEKLTLQSTTPSAPAPAPAAAARTPARTAQPVEFRYTSCAITAPSPDQVFTNVTSVNAGVDVVPSQRPGHRLLINLNGRRVPNWPETAQSYLLSDLFRGSYSLSAQVVDETGGTLCSSPSINFHIRQPTMLTPSGNVPSVPRVPRAPAAPKPSSRP